MGLMEKIIGKSKKEEVDIEEFLNNLDVSEEEMYEDADMYVKPIMLKEDSDIKKAAKELKEGNIVLLNISNLLARNPVRVKQLINKLKSFVENQDGDIARITKEHVLLTPAKVKIVKRK